MEPKIIFHINEMQRWNLLLNNVTNLSLSYKGESSNAIIEVLAHSEAVRGYLQDSSEDYRPAMDRLSQQGVRFVACSRALLGMGITKEEIFQFVHVVPAGVRELADRQMEGYAYIKP